MKKVILFTLLILLSTVLLLSQKNKTVDLFNLKLKTNEVEFITPKKQKNYQIITTYFFFSERGVYGADKHGILLYKYDDAIRKEEKFVGGKLIAYEYIFKAIDTDDNIPCTIKLTQNIHNNKLLLFIIYSEYEYVFYCESIK